MTTSEMISLAMAQQENVNTADADYAQRRVRVLTLLQAVLDALYRAREWPWRRTVSPASVNIAINVGYAVMPADFDTVGRTGHVFHGTEGYELAFRPEDFLAARKVRTSYNTDRPQFYSEYGQDTNFAPLIQIDNNSAALSLKVTYNRTPPTLIDDSATPASDNLLKRFPERYHHLVLLPALQARLALQRGESTQQDYENYLLAGVRTMIREQTAASKGAGRGLRGYLGRCA